jgi:hypothetical protein
MSAAGLVGNVEAPARPLTAAMNDLNGLAFTRGLANMPSRCEKWQWTLCSEKCAEAHVGRAPELSRRPPDHVGSRATPR